MPFAVGLDKIILILDSMEDSMKKMNNNEMTSINGGKWRFSCTMKAIGFGAGFFFAAGSGIGAGAIPLGMSVAWVHLYESGCFDTD